MTQKETTISIILPIYNVERYLPKCLGSIAQQSFGDFEVIVVDDSSTDQSRAIVEDFAQNDDRFCVIHNNNKGLAHARNLGLEVAHGRYIAFVDGDDWIHPQMLEYLLSTLVKTGSDIAMSDFIKTDNSNFQLPDYDNHLQPHVFDGYRAVKSLIENKKTCYTVVWNKIYDRTIIGNTRFLDVVSEDTSFNMELFIKAKTVSYLPLPLVYYRQHSYSITHQATAAYHIDRVASAFLSYDKVLRNNSPQLEKIFLWRWLKYALNRLNSARNTDYELYARQIVSSIMDEYWSDAERLLPKQKQKLLKAMWKNKHFNSLVLTTHKWIKSLKRIINNATN